LVRLHASYYSNYDERHRNRVLSGKGLRRRYAGFRRPTSISFVVGQGARGMHSLRKIGAVSALVMSIVALAPGARAEGDVVVTEEARTHFAAGVVLLQDPKAPRYEEAYREFKTAYAASPSYKILGNLGLCAMKIERDAEAIHAYETYLKEAGPEVSPEQRAQVERDLLALKAGVLDVTVSSDPPGASIIDSRTPVEGPDVRNSYGSILTPTTLGLRHGHHVIVARLPGYLDQQWEFDATESTAPPHVFTMTRPIVADRPTFRERPIPTAAWVSGGATLALGIGGAFFGALALQRHSDFVSVNDGTQLAQANSDRSSGQALNIVTDAFFGGALIGAGITTYLVLSRATVERPASAGTIRSLFHPVNVSPAIGTRMAGATAGWLF
jgi:hypothetical protein